MDENNQLESETEASNELNIGNATSGDKRKVVVAPHRKAKQVRSNKQALKPCSDERQNGFRSLKLKRCKFLQPSFTPCEHVCFCLQTLKDFRFKCLRRFLNIKLF